MQKVFAKNKSCKIFFLVQNTKVYFNADFDSGNVQKVQQICPYIFKIHPGYDKIYNSSNKTFFNFKVFGLKMCKANFIITRMYILEKIIKSSDRSSQYLPQYYPVYKRPNQQFKKVKLQVKKYYNNFDEPQLSFSFEFDNDPYIEFAFSYTYSYEKCQNFIEQITKKYLNHPTIYLHNEILCLTKQNRKVHLITITDKQNCSLSEREKNIEGIFPLTQQNNKRPYKITKPVVFLTARVHPGQSPSSFCIEGAIKFLLNQKDCRSLLLRKNFQFLIVPMLNPDGVFKGMFRNDMYGNNLNRFYQICDKKKHPTIWSVKELAIWLSKNKNVLFYFDFHAHHSTKNFFIYGNSFNEISHQIQAEIFGKMIEANCPYFQNFDSIFAERQMKIKQKNDTYSKQGCARVFMHKKFNIIHSYTVQCGYFGPSKINNIQDKLSENGFQIKDYTQQKYFQNLCRKTYKPQSYMLMGKSILITILDLFRLNPYPKKIKGQNFSLSQLRKIHGNRIYHQIQKFRLVDANSYKKLNDASSIIQLLYYNEKLKSTNLLLASNSQNKLLQQQLYYLNSSPRSNKLIKNAFNIDIKKSFDIQKFKYTKRIKSNQFQQIIFRKTKIQLINGFSPPQNKKSVKKIQNNKKNNVNIRNSIKSEELKYQYNEVERFNEFNEYQLRHSLSNNLLKQQKIKTTKSKYDQQMTNLQRRNITLTKQQQDLIEKKTLVSYKNINKTLQSKQSKPQSSNNSLKTTFQKSMTSRKGSLNKILFIKKDQLRLLRLTNLLTKTHRQQNLFIKQKEKNKSQSQRKRQFPSIQKRYQMDC